MTFISFANVKGETFEESRRTMIMVLQGVFDSFKALWADEKDTGRYVFMNLTAGTPDVDICMSVN